MRWDHYGGFRAAYYPQSYFLLAKVYELRGNPGKAIESYQRFLSLWKHADQNLRYSKK